MKIESDEKTIAKSAVAQPDSKYFHFVDYGTISDEIVDVLEKHKVPVGSLENVFHDVRLKAGWYSPVQNYHGDSD